jgi:hypothetical protein
MTEHEPHDEESQVEDLDVPESESEAVKGGRKAGKGQQDYYEVKLVDVQISSP